MFVAEDYEGNRINIVDAIDNVQYRCPICKEKVEFHNGPIRMHHFAHWKNSKCLDKWKHDMTEWHLAWQNHFPVDQQEVIRTRDEEKHRADVLCGKTVVEFQHSQISSEEFAERNRFYTCLGYKVVWLFDLQEQVKSEKIEKGNNHWNCEWNYIWKWSSSTFSQFNPKNGNVIVFFQFYDAENEDIPCIKRLVRRDVSGDLTKEFQTNYTGFLTAKDFVILIQKAYFDKAIPDTIPINKKQEDIIMPELATYGFRCNITVKENIPDIHNIQEQIVEGFKHRGGAIYEPKTLSVQSLYQIDEFSELSIEFWTFNDCSMYCSDVLFDVIRILKDSIQNLFEIKNPKLLGFSVRDLFERFPSEGKGIIDIETGTDFYVNKAHIDRKPIIGRMVRYDGSYFKDYREVFYAEQPRWVQKFKSNKDEMRRERINIY